MKHDPGGKVRMKLQPGVEGHAWFSACERYRYTLRRTWSGPGLSGTALWIGMNPSTAAADCDDLTVRKEIEFSRRFGFTEMVKVNVMDYRATHPEDLLKPGVKPQTVENTLYIRELAGRADKIILAYGSVHPKLRPYSDRVVFMLRADGRELWCLGFTKDGSPRHPSRIAYSSELVPFR
jgi:hypothetical protein